jgi:hypothetical protein
MIVAGRVWSGGGPKPPGELIEVGVRVEHVEPHALVLPGLTVRCELGGVLDGTDLRADPHAGGGPGATPEERREALVFGMVNTAYHLQRALDRIERLRGRPLPPLLVRVGAHAAQRPTWRGGHYRLPAIDYSTLPEPEPPAVTGEIHLGAGGRMVRRSGRLYRHTAAHDPAIIVHELGHHLTRHTADLRVNERRRPLEQANLKTPLDEGTSDYLTAIVLDSPDIYAWHRGMVSAERPERRHLASPWTMAHFVGGHVSDPHTDGSIWAAALWAARTEVQRRGVDPERFDAVVVRALDRIGRTGRDLSVDAARRLRRRFALVLEAILEEDLDAGGRLAALVEPVFAARGIEVGAGNDDLRDRVRFAAATGAACARPA